MGNQSGSNKKTDSGSRQTGRNPSECTGCQRQESVRTGKTKYFKDLYPIEYVGNAFADKWEGTWYLYNNKVNTNEKQHAILPLEGEEESARLKVEMEPHEFMIMNESGDGTAMDITLNNYRVNKDEIIFDNKFGLTWTGDFSPGPDYN